MAYNRWLSANQSYAYSTDLMHYGRKGMKWGKHIFGFPDFQKLTGGFNVNTEYLRQLLQRGQIDYNKFKEMAGSTGRDFTRRLSDTYENFRAGDGADKTPEVSERAGRPLSRKRNPDDSADKARTESRRSMHQQQGRMDEAEKRARDDEEHRKQIAAKRKERLEHKPSSSSSSTSSSKPSTSSESDRPAYESLGGAIGGYLLDKYGKGVNTSEEYQAYLESEKKREEQAKQREAEERARRQKIFQTIGKYLSIVLKVPTLSGDVDAFKKVFKRR